MISRKVYKRIIQTKPDLGYICTGSGFPLGEKVEQILERNRPVNYPSRKDVTFMRADEAFEGIGIIYDVGYVLTVEPECEVFVTDVYWVGVLQARYSVTENKSQVSHHELSDDEVATNYWNAVNGSNELDTSEYLTKRAKVVSVLSEPILVNPYMMSFFGIHSYADYVKMNEES